MSHSTLDDFYKGMRQPRYDGSNVLSQLQSVQGTSTVQTQVQQTTTVVTQQTTGGRPPVGALNVPPLTGVGSTPTSYDRHVAESKTEQATSKMFNEQSFGR